jgi:hypothetical protein
MIFFSFSLYSGINRVGFASGGTYQQKTSPAGTAAVLAAGVTSGCAYQIHCLPVVPDTMVR